MRNIEKIVQRGGGRLIAASLLMVLRSPEPFYTEIRKAGRKLFGISGSGDVDGDIEFGTAAELDASTDGTLASNSDSELPSVKAVKTYVDTLTAALDVMAIKGGIDCSANPDYPAANCGWSYRVTVAGKIGGASGITVEVGDLAFCLTDGTASGNHATVGAQWGILQMNLVDALTTASIGGTVQAHSDDLDEIAALTTAAYGRSFLTLADAAAAQSSLGLVLTTSTLDTTTGRVLKVGDFGLGSPLNANNVADFSSYQTGAGFLRSGSVVTPPSDRPVASGYWYGFTVNEPAGARGMQLLVNNATAATYVRGHTSGTYTGWNQLVDVDSSQTINAVKTFALPPRLPSYTVATVPSAATYSRGLIYVSDGTGNKRLAISDGTNWRFPDGNIVS